MMLLAIFISNFAGNILLERHLQMFNGVPSEERLHWRTFLVKLGADNLKGARNEELFVSSQKSVYIVYTVLGGVCIYIVGKDEYDELALTEVMFVITSSIKDACGKSPSERLFLDKYGKICLCLDEIVWKNQKADRIKASKSNRDLISSCLQLKAVALDIPPSLRRWDNKLSAKGIFECFDLSIC
ncbi:hypothetical protein Gohar_002619 [Gossypium harknessii]|uniref:Coatomer subunit zeta n=1 Tax=Gossypium harknessii TaxID=34285 RepID=A0A7J9HLB9_9ROSI|nr:hypothetical protein [Gossypium harknessii]